MVRKLSRQLWEVRSNVLAGIARTFFTVDGGRMVLIHGFTKKSQKTPVYELETARQRLKQYHGEIA